MKPVKKRITCIIIIILSACLCLLSCETYSTDKDQPVAVEGVLDLEEWNFEKYGPINLNGQWEFYWQKLLYPDDFSGNNIPPITGWFNIPGRWDQYVLDGTRLSGAGYASFRLRVLLGKDDTLKAIRILNQSSAYTLWANGKIVARNGIVGTGRETMQPQYLLQESTLLPHDGELDLVLQVSNFNHRKGGVWNPIFFGNADQIKTRHAVQWIFDLFVFGSLIIMGLYHICLYLLRRTDLSPLFFAFLCLSIGVRILVTGEYYLTVLFPNIPWELLYCSEMLSVPVTVIMLILFIGSFFSKYTSAIVMRFAVGVELLISLIIVFTPARICSYTVVPHQFIIVFIFILITGILIRAAAKKDISAIIILCGFIFVFMALINDILQTNDTIYTANLAPLGVLFMVLSQSFVLSLRSSRAFAAVETLSVELEEKNIELTRMDKIKDEFLASTSHELRTPLHGIIGISESIIDGTKGELPPRIKDDVSLIASSGHRLSSLVNDILDFSNMRYNELKLNLKPVDIYSITELILKLTYPLIGDKSLEIVNSIPRDIPFVLADEDRMKQVMHNLIGNAVKFTNKGTIEISASVAHSKNTMPGNNTTSGSMMEIRISDTGIGIPERDIDRIFDAFQQADGTDSRAHGGTGLGLAISRQLIEMHGGEIRVISRLNKGSTFTFTLPVSRETIIESTDTDTEIDDSFRELAHDAQVSTGLINIDFENNPVILIVDDDPVNIHVLQNYLSPKACSVLSTTDGLKAIDIIENNDSIDLVLLDIMMPIISGYEVCSRIRERYSPEELPVIMLTAKSLLSDINAGFEAGANDYIVKPFQIRELLSRINTMLKLKNIQRNMASGISISDRGNKYFFEFSEILYITSRSKSIIVHTGKSDIEISVTLKDIIDKLPGDLFIRIHKQYIVNMAYVMNLSHVISGRYRIVLKDEDDTGLPVGSTYLNNLRKKI